ncbi:MAG: hypothetical protein WD734_04640 [Dehalococcoidia bacterium]
MNAASLPYTVLVLLVELAVGGLAVVTLFDARRQVTPGYVKAGALTLLPTVLLAAWAYTSLTPVAEVDGYRLASAWLRPFGVVLAVLVALFAAYTVAVMAGRRGASIGLGTAGSGAGVVALALLAALLGPPAWSTAGMFASLLVAAVVLGAALMSMMWGHWYLTSGRLPKEPMEQMALLLLGAIALQVVLVALGALLPAREVPPAESALGLGLAQNPAFWLRVGVGLLFPLAVTALAWKTATIRGMMSATGLLYIALGALLAGEVLARGLLFTTGAAV